jgi:hypothetical protein
MSLNIISEDEEILVETLNILIYGQPGAGKSSLGFTAKKPLTLDFDKGSHRSSFRKDIVKVTSWSDVAQITSNDLKNYKTVVIDTVGRALDFLAQEIIKENPKNGTRNGGLTIQGWGVLKNTFLTWLKQINLLGIDVVFIAHDKEDKSGDIKFVRPDIVGSSYGEIMKSADFIGYYYLEGSKRVVDFTPCESFIGKNSANLPKQFIPNFNEVPNFFETVIKEMKDTLNHQSLNAKEITNLISNLKKQLEGQKTAEDINKYAKYIGELGLTNGVKNTISQLFKVKVSELGLEYDKASKLYFDKVVEELVEEEL